MLEVEARVNEVMGDEKDTQRVELAAADKGYFKLGEIWLLQGVSIETVISASQWTCRPHRLSDEDRAALEAAQVMVTSEPGREWMRKRSEMVERGFQHVWAAAEHATLRGRENIRKRCRLRAACADLSLLMPHLTRVAPRQALAGSHGIASALVRAILGLFILLGARCTRSVYQDHPLALATT